MEHNELKDMPDRGGRNRDHDGAYHRKHSDIYLDIGNKIYFGNPATNGSFRLVVESGYFELQMLVADTWTYYLRIP